MKVKAKCITPAWDSDAAFRFEPGCGPFDGLYEIESEGPLASLKLGGKYVFEFDRGEKVVEKPVNDEKEARRAAARADAERMRLSRTCSQCSKELKSPHGLRVHIEKAHPVQQEEAATVAA